MMGTFVHEPVRKTMEVKLTDFEIKCVEFLNEIAWKCHSTTYAEQRAKQLLEEAFKDKDEYELPKWARD